MEELIVEGLVPADFLLLEQILKTYKVSLDSEIDYKSVFDLYDKVKQVVNYLQQE